MRNDSLKEKYSTKMSDKDYFSIDAVSNSSFRLLQQSPIHYENRKLFDLQSDSINLGSAVHKLVLEPDDFYDEYAVESFEGCELNKNSKAYKEAKAQWLESVADKVVLNSDKFAQVETMARNVKAIAGGMFDGGSAEIAFISEIDDIKVKCKADYYFEDAGVVVDLKTTASIKEFERKSFVEYGYITQAPFYMDVITSLRLKATTFVFVVVESTKPYNVAVYETGERSLEVGRALYKKHLYSYKEYKSSGIFNLVKTLEAPEWFLEQNY